MNRIGASVGISAIERYGNLCLVILSSALLARLLTPEEFGTFAIASAMTTMLSTSFQEFGGANYLIQKVNLTAEEIRTAFTIMFFISLLIAGLLILSSGTLAQFFSAGSLRIGLTVSSLGVIVTPITITISALLRREMAFGALSVCNLLAGATTAVASVALAIRGYGFLAPIWGSVIGAGLGAALLMGHWRNLGVFKPSLAGYSEVLRFGAYSAGTIIINVIYNFLPQLILGKVISFTSVGLYNRAINVTQTFDRLVVQVLNPVILPAFAEQRRAGGDLKKIYLQSIELISAVQWPFLIFIAMMAEPIIRLWLGSQWMETVPLIRVLCIASLSLFMAPLSYPVLVTVGRVRETFTSSLISLLPSLAIVSVASTYGIWAVALSSLVTLPLQATIALVYVSRPLAISAPEFARSLKRSIMVALCTTASVASSIALCGISEPILGLLSAGTFALGGWSLGLFLTKHPLLLHVRSAANVVQAVPQFPYLKVR